MTGRQLLTVFALSLSMILFSACVGKQQDKQSEDRPGTTTVNSEKAPSPAGGASGIAAAGAGEQVIDQQEAELPDAAFLSAYPGVLHCMSLTLEQIITVLGTNFELYENTAQGYDIYKFPEYGLVLEYDNISEKLSTIWTDNTPYYVYSGTITSFDIDNDGREEEIAAYEDADLNGRVTVFSKDGLILADQTTDYFGGGCRIHLMVGYGPERESLIILDTNNPKECEVFSYTNGKLISMLPPAPENAGEQAIVQPADDHVILAFPDQGITYDCPLPQYLVQSYPDGNTDFAYQFSRRIRPVIKDNVLYLSERNSFQIKFYGMEEDVSTYIDVAQVVREYQYSGGGKWQHLSTTGGPKYGKNALPQGVNANDFRIGEITLLSPIRETASKIGMNLEQYSDYDLLAGVLYRQGGICVGVTNETVSYISLEKDGEIETTRGLKIFQSKQQALDLYGLPDKGYYEDSVWTYYRLRDERTPDGIYRMADSFNIEFDGDFVKKIWMSEYISVY
ncbi:MAG TPA: hypothetical protein PLO77_02575 [Thermoclostridium caenicola]|nr:hypothetical protein [Thermoclostridium caenicola]